MDLGKNCVTCSVSLTRENGIPVKKGRYYRNVCKKCRSQSVMKYQSGHVEHRRAYANLRARRIGRVREYPCEGCSKLCYKKYARAFCSDLCRFMAYVDKQSDCWIWIGKKNKRGYGQLCFKDNRSSVASRVSYELFKGSIEEGKLVCHTCDIPSCVNPDHLWLGTNADNMMDMTEKGRQYSKLTNVEVFKIRKLWEEGFSQSKIMELFKVTSSQISNIIARRIWKHV